MNRSQVFGMKRHGLGLLLHQALKIIERGFCLAIAQNNIADLLQGSEYKKRIDLHGHQLSCVETVSEDQPHQKKEDHLSQCVYKSTLNKTYTADTFYLGEFESQDLIGILIQPCYFLVRETQTFY